MTPQQIRRMDDEDVIIYHRNEWPIWAKRMDWQRFPELVERQRIPAPAIRDLPPVAEEASEDAWQEAGHGRPAFINPDLVQ
jgi:type IV secretory pathway TraG/TraD family ATPase VirD4